MKNSTENALVMHIIEWVQYGVDNDEMDENSVRPDVAHSYCGEAEYVYVGMPRGMTHVPGDSSCSECRSTYRDMKIYGNDEKESL